MGASLMAVAGFSALAGAALVLGGCTSIAGDQRTFDGTRWRVAAISGQETPLESNYRMAFDAGRISGQFGCNHFGGDYRVRGDILTTGAVAMTEMACTGPAGRFEALGLAILPQPMELRWTSAQRLMLANAAGTIALERLP